MTRENYSATGGGTPIDVFPVRAGGTGVTTASAARTALGLVPLGNKDQPSGVAALDANGKLMARYFGPNTPTTIGVIAEDLTPSESLRMPINTTRRYKITNFDSFTTYTVTAVGGSAYIDGDCVVYTSGSTAGTGGFVINGKTYNITVLSSMPVRPVLSTTLAGSTDTDSYLTMTTTAFSNKPSGAATHAATNWQVSIDPYFNQKVIDAVESTTNKTIWTSYSTLERSKTYYARAQFKDSNGNFGEWSDTVVFTTPAQYWPVKEEARLSASDAVAGSEFGLQSACDGGAIRIVVGARSNTTSGLISAGSAYVFLRTDLSWAQEAKLVASDPLAGASFGYSVQMDNTGSRIVVSAPFANNASGVDTGAIYVFLRTGTTWALEAKIVPSDGATGDRFGWDTGISMWGDRIVVSAPAKAGYKGKAYVYVRSGTTWSQEGALIGSDVVAPWTFGSSVEICGNGDRIVVGCRAASNGSITTGAAYVFFRNGVTWTQEAKVVPSDGTSDSRMGSSVIVTTDGIRFAVGDAAGNEGYTASGKVYVYVRSGTTWAQEAIITPPDSEKDGNFGAVIRGNTALSKLAVGATGAVVNGFPQAGATYIFERGTGWNFIAKKVASPPEYAGRSGFPGDVTNFTRLPIGSADGMVSGIRKGYLSILVNA